MLAGKVALARDRGLADLLVAGELRVLPDLPVGVRAQQEWVGQWHVQRRTSVPLPSDAWEHGLDLAQECLGELRHLRGIRGIASERSKRHSPARVVDEESGGPILRARDVPRVLVARVRVSAAVPDPPRPWRVPVPRLELQVELGVLALAQLRDGGLLQRRKPSRLIVQIRREDGAQDGERYRHDHPVDDL